MSGRVPILLAGFQFGPFLFGIFFVSAFKKKRINYIFNLLGFVSYVLFGSKRFKVVKIGLIIEPVRAEI